MNGLLTPRAWQQIAQQKALELAGTPEAAEKLAEAKRYGMLADEIERLNAQRAWNAIDYAPHDRRLLVKSESGEIYVAHWVQNPFTGDEAWLVSEAPDGTQHLIKAVEWREIV